jgi:RNA polymerase sigma-70 factor (ECF subfamily)
MIDDRRLDKLVRRAVAGDHRAFASIYDEYTGRVYAYDRQRLNDPADAEDVTAIVFLKAYEALGRYDHRGVPFSAWLFSIARNAVIDRYRKVGRAPLPAPIEEAEDTPAPTDVEREVLARFDAERIRAAMGELTDEQSEVLELRFFAGLTAPEVAQVTGRTPGAIKALQHRAIRSLARVLEPEAQES